MKRTEFASRVKEKGGIAYLTGGAVRDKMLMQIFPGFKKNIKDNDFMVTGFNVDSFQSTFPEATTKGKGFPVFMLEIDDEICEVALARKEVKSGVGHRGFIPVFSEDTTAEEDAARRETTMSQLFENLHNGEIVDYYNGLTDMKNRQIRMTTIAFKEDPLRVLRVARQLAELAELKFTIEPETLKAMESLKGEIKYLSFERVIEETKKALSSPKPSLFFRTLESTGILEEIFKEVSDLKNCPQSPEHHPEGDALEHTFQVVDAARYFASKMPKMKNEGEVERKDREQMVVMAALLHDVGKTITMSNKTDAEGNTKFTYHGHEEEGVAMVREICARYNLISWIKPIAFMTEYHMILHKDIGVMSPSKVVDFIEGKFERKTTEKEQEFIRRPGLRSSVDVESFIAVCSADDVGRCEDVDSLDERAVLYNNPYASFVREAYRKCDTIKCSLDIKQLAQQFVGEEIGFRIHQNKKEQKIKIVKQLRV